MTQKVSKLKTCPQGHRFYKSSDCPTCPQCEALKKPQTGFLTMLPAPARRALENARLVDLKKLSKLTEKEVLSLHGMGPASMPKLRTALKASGLSFAQQK